MYVLPVKAELVGKKSDFGMGKITVYNSGLLTHHIPKLTVKKLHTPASNFKKVVPPPREPDKTAPGV